MLSGVNLWDDLWKLKYEQCFACLCEGFLDLFQRKLKDRRDRKKDLIFKSHTTVNERERTGLL